jgi:hypothetical protein
VFASDYYIDMVNGNDAYNGSKSNPWKTFNRAKRSAGTVEPGDTVYVRGVTYQFTSQDGIILGSGDGGKQGNPVTYKAYPGENVEFSGIGNTTKSIFLISGAHYIVIDGFHFLGAYPQLAETRSINICSGGDISILHTFMKNIYKGVSFCNNQINNITITDNIFEGNAAPVYLNQNKNVTVARNIFRYTQEGLKMNPHYAGQTLEDVYVYGNFFYQIGWGFKLPDGTLKQFYNPAIVIPHQCNNCGGQDSYIQNVNVYNNIFWGSAGGGIRTQRSDIKIYNNVFYRHGYYDTHVLDNSVGGHGVGIVIQNSGVYVQEIKNNIFYDNKSWAGSTDIVAENGATYSESNNLTGNPDFINGDPIIVDPYNPANYKISGNSPAVNKGANIKSMGVTTDFFGNARPVGSGYDIGAYEFGGVPGDTLAPAPPANLQVVLN